MFFNVTSILNTGLIAVGRESKGGRQNIFLTCQPVWGQSRWGRTERWFIKAKKSTLSQQLENTQNNVYWINSAGAQDKGLRFLQARSHALIVHNSVQADCTYKVISQKGKRTFFETHSTPRPAAKLVLKSAWQSQQQRQPQQQDTSESLPAPGNWCGECKERRERTKATQQRTQNCPLPGNWSGVLSHVLKQ